MIKEAYVSFEIAKLLKEKGFDGSSCCNHFYFFNLDGEPMCFSKDIGLPLEDNEYYAPTHQMAIAWLRKRGIDCIVDISDITARPRKYYAIIWDNDNKSHIIELFDDYEETVEAALKYCLENLIEKI